MLRSDGKVGLNSVVDLQPRSFAQSSERWTIEKKGKLTKVTSSILVIVCDM